MSPWSSARRFPLFACTRNAPPPSSSCATLYAVPGPINAVPGPIKRVGEKKTCFTYVNERHGRRPPATFIVYTRDSSPKIVGEDHIRRYHIGENYGNFRLVQFLRACRTWHRSVRSIRCAAVTCVAHDCGY